MEKHMRRWRKTYIRGHAVRIQSTDPNSQRARVTARSEKHAERLASELDWQTTDGGVGRPFTRLDYSPSRKRLELVLGYDI